MPCLIILFLTSYSHQHDAQLDYYGKRLATCSSDRTIRIFNVIKGEAKGEPVILKGYIVLISLRLDMLMIITIATPPPSGKFHGPTLPSGQYLLLVLTMGGFSSGRKLDRDKAREVVESCKTVGRESRSTHCIPRAVSPNWWWIG